MEITVFTDGDSSKLSTWSNVPYFFTETLIEKGIKVNRVDVSASPLINKIYNKFFNPIITRLCKGTSYTYYRSPMHYCNVRKRIKKAIRQYNQSDAFIFLSLSISSVGLTNKPTVMFGDWTYDYFIEHFQNRKPDFFERKCIQRDHKQIDKAELVIPLFPGNAAFMKQHYKNPNIHYLGNVVNSLLSVSEKEILEKKANSKDLLLIGRKNAYLDGAIKLIEAVDAMKSGYPGIKVHIIGMKDSDFDYLPDFVTCYGYLDKADDEQRSLYYSLMQNAKALVNTTPKWGAFSSMIEAMYFYNPVITTPYNEFIETFGNQINVGYFSENQSKEELISLIKLIFTTDNYAEMCINSHNAVKDFTWNAYIDKILKLLKSAKL